ncbi:MAG: head GIN domain-containing protein [Chitinophagaceae bacterium]
MKKLTTAILITAATLGIVSCKKDVVGDGPIATETRNVPSFTGIDLRMNGNVYYTAGSERKVEITARQSIHSMLETTIIDNRLVIRYRNGKTYDTDESIRINITAPDVNSLFLTTSGSIFLMNDLHTTNLMLRSWGSGSIFLQKVFANNIDAETTVSGRINAAGGTTVSEKLKTDGSGKIDLAAVAARSVTARTIGSGDIKLKVSDDLDVTIQGSGSVYFSGYPFISTHISGSGRLVRM